MTIAIDDGYELITSGGVHRKWMLSEYENPKQYSYGKATIRIDAGVTTYDHFHGVHYGFTDGFNHQIPDLMCFFEMDEYMDYYNSVGMTIENGKVTEITIYYTP